MIMTIALTGLLACLTLLVLFLRGADDGFDIDLPDEDDHTEDHS